MKFAAIALVICLCIYLSEADIAHLRAAKAKLLGRLKERHHKRGILSHVPTYKAGHDIPLVTHSVVKPLVVTYPPTASVTAVKIPLPHHHPLYPKYPVPVGHRVPVPHPHYGLKFPHHKAIQHFRPDNHFHHHHHHITPRPVLPLIPAPPIPIPAIPATPVVPIPQPTVFRQVQAPSPSVVLPPAPPLPALPPFNTLTSNHVHLRPLAPAVPTIPIQPAPLIPSAVPFAPQYVIRPGNAIQASYFATYPRYPFSFQPPIIPYAPPAVPSPVGLTPQLIHQTLQHPQYPQYIFPQGIAHTHGVAEHSPNHGIDHAFLQPTHLPQPVLNVQPTHPSVQIDHNGWSPLPQTPEIHQHTHPDLHIAQPQDFAHQLNTGHQVIEQHTDEQQYHELQHQLQHHIQQQLEQAQYEQSLHNHQVGQDLGQHVGHEYANHDYSQQGQVSINGHDSQQPGQEYGAPQQEYTTPQQEYGAPQQEYGAPQQEYGAPQQEYGAPQQEYGAPQQEYGQPQQGFEGRSGESDAESQPQEQQFHNHIPLGLQPPIDRPPEQFR